MITKVTLARKVTKGLAKLPQHIVTKLMGWVSRVEQTGLEATRAKNHGYHDEPLHGNREGQRSIRLSDSYRAVYEIKENEISVKYVYVKEIHKHHY